MLHVRNLLPIEDSITWINSAYMCEGYRAGDENGLEDIWHVLCAVTNHLEVLHAMLATPKGAMHIETASGNIGVPLGMLRIKVSCMHLFTCLDGFLWLLTIHLLSILRKIV